jgi:hypothetical protein
MKLDSVRIRCFQLAIFLLQFGWPSRANRSVEPVQSSHETFPDFRLEIPEYRPDKLRWAQALIRRILPLLGPSLDSWWQHLQP